MKKESKTLIVSVIIILIIALAGFNLKDITGAFTEKAPYPLISVYRVDFRGNEFPKQDTITAGEKIRVKVKVGEYCVDPEITFHKYNEKTRTTSFNLGSAIKRGTSRICKPKNPYQGNMGVLDDKNTFTVDKLSSASWETGTYHASVYYFDPNNKRSDKSEIRVYFDVINKNEK